MAIDETGNYNGVYQATYFGVTPTAATGIDGVTNTAVDFGAQAPPMLAVYPPDPNNPSSTGGIAVEHKNFTIEHWIRFNANPGHGTALWGSNAPGAIGPLHEASFGMEAGELRLMWRLSHWKPPSEVLTDGTSPGGTEDNIARIGFPDGFETGLWYYIAYVVVSPTEESAIGTQNLYIYDGTTVFVDEKLRDAAFVDPGYTVESFSIGGIAVGNRVNAVFDEFKIFDEAFDPNSFLVQEFNIPEPTSLAMLGISTLLLAQRRRKLHSSQ